MRTLLSSAAGGLLSGVILAACATANDAERPSDDVADTGVPRIESEGGLDAAPSDSGDSAGSPPRLCTVEGWCQTKLPANHDLRDVWGDGQGIVWAVSGEGSILRWDGTSWQVTFSTEGALAAVWGSSPTDLWVGGARGLLHGTGTSSITWQKVDLGEADVEVQDIGGTSATDIWVVGKNAIPKPRVFHLSDRDAGFTQTSIEPLDSHEYAEAFTEVRRVWTTTSGDVWLTGSIVGFMFEADLLFRRGAGTGSAWVAEPWPAEFAPNDYSEVAFTGGGTVGNDVWLFGMIDDRGAHWWTGPSDGVVEREDWSIGRWKHPLDSSADSVRRRSVWGLSRNDVWVVGTSGRIQHWNGNEWRTVPISLDGIPITANMSAIWGRTNDDLWVVGGNRAFHKVSTAEAALLNAAAAEGEDGS